MTITVQGIARCSRLSAQGQASPIGLKRLTSRCHTLPNITLMLPVTITCFTDRRSPRARERVTLVGRLVFVCVRSGVYFPVTDGAIAPPAQALCDYVYLSRRQATAPE